MFITYIYRQHNDLHSFPTRRSSDLRRRLPRQHADRRARLDERRQRQPPARADRRGVRPADAEAAAVLRRPAARSEEHTSELQSRRDLVCRLLLEKKKIGDINL